MKRLDLLRTLATERSIEERTAKGTPFGEVLEARLSRRDALKGSLGLAAVTFFAGTGLTACGGDDDDDSSGDGTATSRLTFDPVALNSDNAITVPEGYEYQVVIPWGTGITGGFPAFDPSGATTNSAAEQAQQTGSNHDGMHFFPLGEGNSERGILCVNHEYTNGGTLYGNAGRTEDESGAPTVADEVRKDINAHGVSVVELRKGGDGAWQVVNSGKNRRITAATPMQFSGPVAGTEFLVTAYDNSGMTTRGTVNNCGNGYTPWNTYITCEENIQGYVYDTSGDISAVKQRYGISESGFGYLWAAVAGDASEVNGEFARFDTAPTGASANEDYRNEANCFGWIVEIDPMNPSSTPKKRTAMGRFRHEGAAASNATPGKPLAFYMGDDSRFEYIYKFVTAEDWNPDSPNPDMLDNGTLYVAVFNSDGTGEWRALDLVNNPTLQTANVPELGNRAFKSQAEVLVYTRLAADVVKATPMDRPEWATVDPNTGEVYFTLTNNTDREADQTSASNPRGPNTHGHVIRISEDGDDPAATTFAWDIFVFGSNASADATFNLSGLTEKNEFGGPDGMWMDPRGVLWIETDNGAPLDSGSNDMLLAVVPANLGDDRTVRPDNQADLRRFLVGPSGCEVTGLHMTPDHKTLFVNVQHPGGTWPGGEGTIPRSATVAVSRKDGGEIAL